MDGTGEGVPEQRPERKAWCAEREIKPATYYRWEHEVLTRVDVEMSKRSANRGTPEEPVAFVELPEAGINKKEGISGKGGIVAEMETKKERIRVYEGADAEGRPGFIRGGVMQNDFTGASQILYCLRICVWGLTGLRG